MRMKYVLPMVFLVGFALAELAVKSTQPILTPVFIDWAVVGSIATLLTSAVSYRVVTRRFGWGPSDS